MMKLRRPRKRVILRFVAGALALATLVLGIIHFVQRSSVESTVKRNLAERREAIGERIEVLVRAKAAHLLACDPNDALQEGSDIGMEAGKRPFYVKQVGEENLYTGVLTSEHLSIPVAVELPQLENVYLWTLLDLRPVEDILEELWPGEGGRVYITNPTGWPVLRYPLGLRPEEATEHRKFRLTSDATEGIARKTTGEDTYKDLDDREAVGAFGPLPVIHGGIVVEQDQRRAFAGVRGVQPWHITGALFSLSLLLLLGSMLAPRVKFTQDLFRLFAYAKKYWFLITLTLLSMGVYATGNLTRLTLMKTVFDDVLLGKGAGAVGALWWVIQWFSVIVLVMAAASWFKAYLTKYITQAITNDIRLALMRHLLTLDMKFFDRQRVGEIISRLSNDVGETRKSLGLLFGEFFQAPLMLIGALGAAFIVNWRLSLMIFAGLPLIIFPISRLGRMVKKYSKRRQVQRGVVTEVMMQTISGLRTVKAFQMEERENRLLTEVSTDLLTQTVRVARTIALSRTVIDIMNSVAGVMVLAIGGYMVIHGTAGASAADLMTLSVIMAQMYKPVKDITKTYNNIQECLAGAERVFEIMDMAPEIVDRPDAVWMAKPEHAISFENVTFAYEEQPVLKNISFTVPVGSVAALVGETGAGKSTVTDLVSRLYDPQEGRVTMDGRDLREIRIDSLRGAISTVTQDAFLFNATIRENILYAKPDSTNEEVEEAARAAGIHDEILRMDNGYDTFVGERGTRLSGGQRQRVTIARAILKDSPILILDEATSALDSQTEAIVQEALNRLMTDRTTFVIAHRLSTISHADMILVLRNGELVEQGSHERLMAREGGVYQGLHQIQFAGTNGS